MPKVVISSIAAVEVRVFFEGPFPTVLPLEASLEGFGLETIARFFGFG
jgi:hypothetical protein